MAFTPEELADGELLSKINSGTFSPANPFGMGQGGQRNFIAAADALSRFGSAVVREATLLHALIEALTGSAQIAAVIVEGGPVSSVQVGDGAVQTGAVKIDLSALSAQVSASLKTVQDAQAALTAAQAGLLTRSRAYALAFGG